LAAVLLQILYRQQDRLSALSFLYSLYHCLRQFSPLSVPLSAPEKNIPNTEPSKTTVLIVFLPEERVVCHIGKAVIKLCLLFFLSVMIENKIGACAKHGSKRRNQNDTYCLFHFVFLSKRKRPPDLTSGRFYIFDFNIQS
jgi:hypothetical protein